MNLIRMEIKPQPGAGCSSNKEKANPGLKIVNFQELKNYFNLLLLTVVTF